MLRAAEPRPAGLTTDLGRTLGRVRGALRSRPIILGELGAIALGGLLLTLLPQADEDGYPAFLGNHPSLARLTVPLGLHELLYTPLFLGLVALTTITLSIVLWDQWRRALRLTGTPPDAASFARVPLRREFVVPRGRAGAAGETVRVEGRLGTWGTPLFHLGLLLIVLAGAARAGFGRDAVQNLVEGQPWPAGTPFGAEWGTAFSPRFGLPETVRVEALTPTRHPSGRLSDLSATLRIGEGEGARA